MRLVQGIELPVVGGFRRRHRHAGRTDKRTSVNGASFIYVNAAFVEPGAVTLSEDVKEITGSWRFVFAPGESWMPDCLVAKVEVAAHEATMVPLVHAVRWIRVRRAR